MSRQIIGFMDATGNVHRSDLNVQYYIDDDLNWIEMCAQGYGERNDNVVARHNVKFVRVVYYHQYTPNAAKTDNA